MNGKPTGTFVEGISRELVTTDLVASLVTATMTSTALLLTQGDTVASLTFLSGGTALGTPSHGWAALYDGSGNLLGQSADQPSLAWAADTAVTFTLATSYKVASTGIYYAALCVVATTVPTLMGRLVGTASRLVAAGGVVTGQVVLCQRSGSALTDTAPATIATPTTLATQPYCVAS
jgi:hypothetical protein